MKIEILKDHEAPIGRMVGQGDQRRERFHQRAFAHMGGPFPVEFRLPLENMSDYYPAGEYMLDPSSFRIGRYQDLELNQYGIKLNPVRANATPKAVNS
jgi:hypothetical protein